MKKIKRIIAVICSIMVFISIPTAVFANDNESEERQIKSYYEETITIDPGESKEIIDDRVYIDHGSATFEPGVWIGAGRYYDGSYMAFEIQATYADGSTDGTQLKIDWGRSAFGFFPEFTGYFAPDGRNRKFDNIGIRNTQFLYMFRYHNTTSKAITVRVISYSW